MEKVTVNMTVTEAKAVARLLVVALNLCYIFSATEKNYRILHTLKEKIEAEILKN